MRPEKWAAELKPPERQAAKPESGAAKKEPQENRERNNEKN